MLCQFTVENFKSIKGEITFDMQAAAISEHEDQVIYDRDGECYLPVSVLYGPNGGGKSNVLEALYTLDCKVLRPLCAACDKENCTYRSKKVPVVPFAFSESGGKNPTKFEVFFRTPKAEYRYILHVKREVIVFESLDKIRLDAKRHTRSALFSRSEDGVQLKGIFGKFKISEDLSDTLPLLSYLGITYKRNEAVQDVLLWFEKNIDFLNYGNPYQELRTAIARSGDIKQLVLNMIREMDLDIEDFRVEEEGEEQMEVFTKHVVGGYGVEISLFEESSGTKKLFGLLPFIARSLKEGTTLVIDELDAKIHPVLLRYIIDLYTDMKINKNHGQLIFTSHDLSTMSNEVFRRDEIRFVAKGTEQNSELYSLVEFKNDQGASVRKDAKYDKQYLEGKYGADPYLRKIIDWSDVNA